MKQCLVTGGLGFIGQHVSHALLRRGWAVRILDNLRTSCVSPESLAGEGAEVIVGDVTDPDACRRAVREVDAIVHLAAQTSVQASLDDPSFDFRSNVLGTFLLLESARREGARKFIFASSNAVFGPQTPPLHEDLLPKPVSPYGAGKLAAETYCRSFHRQYNLDAVCLRFANVYGPGSDRKSSVVAAMIRPLQRGRSIQIYGDGQQTRDLIFVGDIVQCILLALESEAGGEVFTVGTGVETTVNDVARILGDIARGDLGRSGIMPVEHLPTRPADVRRNFSSIARAQRLLGFNPRVGLEDGLKRTWDWFRMAPSPVRVVQRDAAARIPA